jgi:hypothetical protein
MQRPSYQDYMSANDDAAANNEGAFLFGNRQSTLERKQVARRALQAAMADNNATPGGQSPAAARELPAAGGRRLPDINEGQPSPRQSPPPQPPRQIPPTWSEPPQMSPKGGGGGPGGGGGDGGGMGPPGRGVISDNLDARFRAIERQCQELREEQRQMVGWLAKSQEQLSMEVPLLCATHHRVISTTRAYMNKEWRVAVALRIRLDSAAILQVEAREKAERVQGVLQQALESADKRQDQAVESMSQLNQKMGIMAQRLANCEAIEGRTQVEISRAHAQLTDAISHVSSDVNAISFHLAGGGSVGNDRIKVIARQLA